MSDDYLWDGSGAPDPEIVHLEQLLGRLRSTSLPPALPVDAPRDAAQHRFRALAPFLATAAAIALMVGSVWRVSGRPSWEVASISGAPKVGSAPISSVGRLALGETLTTDSVSTARIHVATIGQVTIDPNSSVRLVGTQPGRHHLALAHGTLHAVIVAPPGQFVVDTKSATATDLGCIYTLRVDESGTGMLSVTVGWVAFEYDGRESFVPAGASSSTDAVHGPGTPRYDDTSDTFRAALQRFDSTGDRDALHRVLSMARARDAMTLFHLIARTDPTERGAVVDALAARAPMPEGVTRAGVLQLDRPMLDHWWDSLGIGEATWWRKWKGPVTAS
jgi:ferric-dicitrate binding protein FerR (iron transport regulator)